MFYVEQCLFYESSCITVQCTYVNNCYFFCWIIPLTYMQCSSLILLVSFDLKFSLFQRKAATPHLLYFFFFLSSGILVCIFWVLVHQFFGVKCFLYTAYNGSLFLDPFHLCFLIGEVGPFTLSVITDRYGLIPAIVLFHFFDSLSFPSA